MVSFELDDFILHKDKAFYSLLLEDGRTIFQDDERYGGEDRAWTRIKKFLSEGGLRATQINIHFRRERVTALNLKDYDGIYFCNRLSKDIMSGEYDGELLTNYSMRFGILKDGVVSYTQFRVPELTHEEDGILENFREENIIEGQSKVNTVHNEEVRQMEKN